MIFELPVIEDTVSGVATLIPGDLNLETVHPESAHKAVRPPLGALGDEWQIIPKAGVSMKRRGAFWSRCEPSIARQYCLTISF